LNEIKNRRWASGMLPTISAMMAVSGGDELLPRDRLPCHALEATKEFVGDVLSAGGEHFGHRAIVAEQVDDEGFPQCVVDTLGGKQIADVEQVAWLLAVERSNDFAAVEIGE
jgi:hypothetical protein